MNRTPRIPLRDDNYVGSSHLCGFVSTASIKSTFFCASVSAMSTYLCNPYPTPPPSCNSLALSIAESSSTFNVCKVCPLYLCMYLYIFRYIYYFYHS
ncbi:hypothetical protein Y032_0061g3280 [Ancylostoma ceylanicum]|uniref:Uncharacterized protein n=1 Tax=Ancylostoma ceylanicum TaxID=53326 RepID=A0A016U2H1_9BILA|nr:hypothetical protein Y032_0061g3280 [Ancylostoma ceylanicum]